MIFRTEMNLKTTTLLAFYIVSIGSVDEQHFGDTATSKGKEVNYNDMTKPQASSEDCNSLIREGRPQRFSVTFGLTSVFRGKNMTHEMAPSFSNYISTIGGIFLNLAVSMRKLDLLKDLINIGSRLDVSDENGVTPLFRALEMDFNEGCHILVKCGADVNFMYRNVSLLHLAVKRGTLHVLQKLVDLEAMIDTEDTAGYTPLMLAVKTYKSDIAQFLLSKGANINYKSSSGRSLLHKAVVENDFDSTRQIILLGADIDTEDIREHSPLYTALRLNYSEILDELLEHRANLDYVSINGNPILHTAVSEGLEHVVMKLVELGANVSLRDSSGLSPLHRAIEADNMDMLIKLMKFYRLMNGTLPGSGDYPIHFAIRKGSIKSTILLLENHKAIYFNKKGLTPFALAVYLNQSTIVKFFFHNRPYLETKLTYNIVVGNHWYSPLHLAVIENNLLAAENLIIFGAMVNQKDKEGKTPLWKAVESNSSAMIDLLLSKGANISRREHKLRNSMIHVAVYNECIKCVESLIASGADVNAPGEGCVTPFLIATMTNNDHLINTLVSKGANVNFEHNCTIDPTLFAPDDGSVSNLKSVSDLIDKNETRILIKKAVEINKPKVLRYLIGNSIHMDQQRISLLMRMAVKRGNVEAMKVLMKFGLAADETKGHESLLSIALENRQPRTMDALLKYGANMNFLVKLPITTPSGVIKKSWSLLHQASFLNAVEEAAVLVDNGMDINIKDDVLWTPLHVAAMAGSYEAGQFLIQKGADVNARTIHGYTPLCIAEGTNSIKMIKLLSYRL